MVSFYAIVESKNVKIFIYNRKSRKIWRKSGKWESDKKNLVSCLKQDILTFINKSATGMSDTEIALNMAIFNMNTNFDPVFVYSDKF